MFSLESQRELVFLGGSELAPWVSLRELVSKEGYRGADSGPSKIPCAALSGTNHRGSFDGLGSPGVGRGSQAVESL